MKPETQAKLDQYLREKESGSLPSPVTAHGPGGLLSHPGMGERKRRRAEFLHTLVNKIGISQEKAIGLLGMVDKMAEVTKPGGKSPGPSIKNPRVYEALKRQGYDKARAAAISSAMVKK